MNNLLTIHVTPAKEKVLSPHLANYNVLCDVLAGIDFNADDLERMLALELRGKKRAPVLKRLLARLHIVERDMRLAQIRKAIK